MRRVEARERSLQATHFRKRVSSGTNTSSITISALRAGCAAMFVLSRVDH